MRSCRNLTALAAWSLLLRGALCVHNRIRTLPKLALHFHGDRGVSAERETVGPAVGVNRSSCPMRKRMRLVGEGTLTPTPFEATLSPQRQLALWRAKYTRLSFRSGIMSL